MAAAVPAPAAPAASPAAPSVYPLGATASTKLAERDGGPYLAVAQRLDHPVWRHCYAVYPAKHDKQQNKLVAIAKAKIRHYLCAHCGTFLAADPSTAKRHVDTSCKSIPADVRADYKKAVAARKEKATADAQRQLPLSLSSAAASATAEVARVIKQQSQPWLRSSSVQSQAADEALILLFCKHYLPFSLVDSPEMRLVCKALSENRQMIHGSGGALTATSTLRSRASLHGC
jgi:hypothetical protein